MHDRVHPRRSLAAGGIAALVILGLLLALSSRTNDPARAAAPAPVTISGNVVDAVSQQPLPGAWVVIAEADDMDGDGVLAARHAFTDASGAFSITLPSSQPFWNLAMAASGHANFCQAVGSLISTNVNFELHPHPAGSLVWGRLSGPTSVSGIEIHNEHTDPDAISITDETGMFAVLVESGQDVDLRIQSAAVEPRYFTVNTSADVPIDSPESIAIEPRIPRQTVQVQAVSQLTGAPAPDGTGVRLIAYVPAGGGEPSFEEVGAVGGGAGAYTSTFGIGPGETLHAVAVGSGGWGHVVIPTPLSGPVTVTLGDAGTAAIDVTLHRPVNTPSGTVRLEVVLADAGSSEELTFDLASASLDAASQVSFTALPPGRYRMYFDNGLWEENVGDVVLSAGEQRAHSAMIHAPPLTTFGVGSGKGSVRGSVTVPSPALLGAAKVYVLDPKTKQIVAEGDVDSGANFLIDGVPAGDWFLLAEGTQTDGKALRQIDGYEATTVFTGQTASPPALLLRRSIGLAVIAIEDNSAMSGVSNEFLTNVTVRLYAGGVLVATGGNGASTTTIFEDVPANVDQIEVDPPMYAPQTRNISFAGQDPNDAFEVQLFSF